MSRSLREGSESSSLVSAITRRRFLASAGASFASCGIAGATEYPLVRPSEPFRFTQPASDVVEQVLPKAGVATGVAFGDSIQTVVTAGVLDPDKYRALAKDLPDWVERLLAARSDDPILFSEETAPYLVNLLWSIGLSTKAAFNEESPVHTLRIPGFASTGGWTLGQKQNGYVYFNQVEAVRMTDQEQKLVLDAATTTFRPCCDNSTYYQDCNHGSALLGLLELAASQGATLEGLYGVALTANSFWFPEQYSKTALYFSHFHRKSWSEVSPKLVLGSDFSSLSGWEKNVNDRLLEANVTLPGQSKGQQSC